MFKIIAYIHLFVLNSAYAEKVRIYVKEIPVTYEVPAEESDLCASNSAPWVVLSKADKAKLEKFVKGGNVEDPNLALP